MRQPKTFQAARRKPSPAALAKIDSMLAAKRAPGAPRKYATDTDIARKRAKWRHYAHASRARQDREGTAARQRKWNQAAYRRRTDGKLPMKHDPRVNLSRLHDMGALRIVSVGGTKFRALRTFTREELAVALGYQPVTISRWLTRGLLPQPPGVTGSPATGSPQWHALTERAGVITRRGVHVYTEAQVRRFANILHEHFETTSVFLRVTHSETIEKLAAAAAYRYDSPGAGPPDDSSHQ